MPRYTFNRPNVTVTNGNDIVTISAQSGKRVRLLRLCVTAAGTASGSQNQVQVGRSTAGTTGGGAITPQPLSSDSGTATAAGADCFTTWAVQPTLAANAGYTYQLSSNGAIRSEAWGDIDCIEARGNGTLENISIRSISGATTISVDGEFEVM